MPRLTEDTVRRELLALLKTVDFEKETERTVRQKLAQRLQCQIDPWKRLVKVKNPPPSPLSLDPRHSAGMQDLNFLAGCSRC